MKNIAKLSVIALTLCVSQPVFGAFPVKHNSLSGSSVINRTEPVTAKTVYTNTRKSSWFTTHVTNPLRPYIEQLNPVKRRSDTFGTLSLVFGIAGIIFSPLSVPAIIFAIIGLRNDEEYSRAGLILGIIGAVILTVLIVLIIE